MNKNSDKPISLSCDVLVVGTGSGGISAAVSAARNGADVLAIDRSGFVGGMMVSGIPYLGFLDSKKELCVGGLATEFVEYLHQNGATPGVRYCPKHLSTVEVDPEKTKLAAAKFFRENGVRLLLHTALVGADVEDGRLVRVHCQCEGTPVVIEAKVFIDATGHGTLSYLAGAEYEKGVAGVDLQPPSIAFTIGGVNKERFIDYLIRTGDYDAVYTPEYLREAPNYTVVCLSALWNRLNPLGKWPMGIWAFICVNRLNDSEVTVNGPRMACTDTTNPFDVTSAEQIGQQQAADFVDMLREEVDGFENAFLSHLNESICTRETRRVVGIGKLTAEDVRTGRTDEGTLSLGSYPIDIHSSKDFSSEFYHVDKPYGIPYLASVSATVKGLMMSGRCISVDPVAFGSYRVMGTCFAYGEGVGIGAALAVKQGIDPGSVDPRQIRAILRENGALLEK